MILRYEHGQLVEQRTYREALHLEADVSPVISIVGAGGKTTTIRHLAQEYADTGWKAAVTTTTHMQIEARSCFLLDESMERFQKLMEQERQVWFGVPAPIKKTDDEKKTDHVKKMQAVSEDFFQQVLELQIPILIEADGSRHLPCKAPGDREPVLRKETTDVLAVYGLDAVGKSIRESCFRPEIVAEILQKKQSDILCAEDIAVLATNVRGGRKDVLKSQHYRIILNKADGRERVKIAEQICKKIVERECLDIIVTSQTSEGVRA